MRKALLVLIVLAAACGKPTPKLAEPITSATPGSAASAAPGATVAAQASAAPGSSTKPGTVAAKTPAPAPASAGANKPVPTAAPGTLRRPAPGNYVYAVSGYHPDPQSASGKTDYPPGAKQTIALSASGDDYTATATDSSSGITVKTTTRFQPDKILLVKLDIATPLGSYSCAFTPPVEIAHVPPKIETFAEQKGSNSDCSWDVKISFLRQEKVTEAGREWTTWVAHQDSDVTMQTLQSHAVGDIWTSPDLGTTVRSDQTTTTKLGASSYQGHTVSDLLTYPS